MVFELPIRLEMPAIGGCGHPLREVEADRLVESFCCCLCRLSSLVAIALVVSDGDEQARRRREWGSKTKVWPASPDLSPIIVSDARVDIFT